MTMFVSETLNAVLHAELAAGNRVAEDGPGWGSMKRLVILQEPFHTTLQLLPGSLSYREVNDPHYWKAEIVDRATMELLACRFG